MKKFSKALMGVLLLPLLLAVYISDRIVLSVMVWMDSDRIDVWFNDSSLILRSIVRLSVALLILFIVWLIKH